MFYKTAKGFSKSFLPRRLIFTFLPRVDKLPACCVKYNHLSSCLFQSPPLSKSRSCWSLVPCLLSYLRWFGVEMVQTIYLLIGEDLSSWSCCSFHLIWLKFLSNPLEILFCFLNTLKEKWHFLKQNFPRTQRKTEEVATCTVFQLNKIFQTLGK